MADRVIDAASRASCRRSGLGADNTNWRYGTLAATRSTRRRRPPSVLPCKMADAATLARERDEEPAVTRRTSYARKLTWPQISARTPDNGWLAELRDRRGCSLPRMSPATSPRIDVSATKP